jgi:hypothetical protein
MLFEVYLQDKQDIKNHNNYMIYKSLQLGKPVMQKLILNNSIDEEEKSVIHKLNQVIAMFFKYWKKSDMDYID